MIEQNEYLLTRKDGSGIKATDKIIHDAVRVKPLKERIEDLIKEAMSSQSARSKNKILAEALILVGDLK